MTPAAITPAGRAASKQREPAPERPRTTGPGTSRRPAGATVPGHRRWLRSRTAPNAPRRVSGPARERLADDLPPRPRTDTRPRGKARRTRRRSSGAPLGARALAFARGLPDHPLLDRLIRGRAWIPVLGVMLVGIVAMQVEVLKLGASIGRSIERSATLQTRNDQLRLAVAALDGDQRIERLAAARGMIMPAPDTIGFLSATQGGNVNQAIANVRAPDANGFLSQMTSNGGIATLAGSLAAASSSGSSTGTPSTATATSTAPVGTDSGQSTTASSGGLGQSTAASSGGLGQSTAASSGGADIPVGG